MADGQSSIGQPNEVAEEIARNPELFLQVFRAVLAPNQVIRMRAANAISPRLSYGILRQSGIFVRGD